ncbi:hypothetical protein ABTX77_38150 [Streptomyces sp. NPDC097704]|uniref:hypothetical protein n=1 Tax=Streptomyces sp. NPDC097704 TaxID=3157101 RepID=UPI00333413D8
MGDRHLTVFGTLVRERGWGYARFSREFRKVCADLRLDDVTPQRKQYDRWRLGQIKGVPRRSMRGPGGHVPGLDGREAARLSGPLATARDRRRPSDTY